MKPAPIALFVFNRPWHAQQTVDALRRNELAGDSELYIYSDGPRSDADTSAVMAVRKYLRSINGFKEVIIREQDDNAGLAQSIIAGVTDIVNRYGRIIVLEDDMVTSAYFLKYMNEALEFYADSDRVISINGYIYPVQSKLPETFFLKGAECWGWATWKRGWDLFDPDGNKLLHELKAKKLTYEFDFNGSYGYSRMLEDQVNGKNNSWAIRWYASAFLKDKLTLYPGRSLVRNIGMDASGTHCSATDVFSVLPADIPVPVEAIPLEEDDASKTQVARFFRQTCSPFRNILVRFRAVMNRILR